MMLSGCRGPTAPTAAGPTKIKICYLGLTCEPPIFVAYENGFFQEEGLDVELVKTDWNTMREGLADGRFQASYSFIMYLMKPIEMGLDFKLSGGIHTGCLRIQAATKTDIKTVADLKGKRVGVTHMGSPPFLFASRVLADKGIDPKKEIEWVTMPGDAMAKALDQGRIEALASAEPIGTREARSVDGARACGGQGEVAYQAGLMADASAAGARPSTSIDWWTGGLFAIGSICFAVGKSAAAGLAGGLGVQRGGRPGLGSGSVPRMLPAACSGGMYASVPRMLPACVNEGSEPSASEPRMSLPATVSL
jgi:hypothetical protein